MTWVYGLITVVFVGTVVGGGVGQCECNVEVLEELVVLMVNLF